MTGISNSGQYNEVDDASYVGGLVSVTDVQTLLKVGASNLSGRQTIIIFNKSSTTLYLGPTGVTTATGIPIYAQQEKFYSFGENTNIYAIAATAGPFSVIVQESA